ncbi:MAG: hypothetical protein LUD81_00425, partial [Clostridiales bacterium]|nr:hypothetical protein [Clostridiales bacterium]
GILMDTPGKIEELLNIKSAEPSEARLRLEMLFDENSFVELEGFTKGANVITGYSSINGKLCFAYSQDGPVNKKHANKISNLYDKAINMGAPIVGILDSTGIEIKDGQKALEAYGILFQRISNASGLVPQIAVVLGRCLGTAAYIPMLSDIRIMKEENANMFLKSPAVLKGTDEIALNYDDFCSGEAHATKTGLVHRSYKTEEDCLGAARRLIDLLPSNNVDMVYTPSNADLNREDESLNFLIEDQDSPIDMNYLISSLADDYTYFEIQPRFGVDMICAFLKINGYTVGIMANNGAIGIGGTLKASRFVKLCDAFNIPLVSLTDIKEYEKINITEQNALMLYSSQLLSSLAESSIPRVNVIIRNGIGSGFMLMNSKYIGADIVLAWPTAEISLLNRTGYVNIMHKYTDKTYDEACSAYKCAEEGYIDDIIIPSTTRKHIIAALEMLFTKRVQTVAKKHGSM